MLTFNNALLPWWSPSNFKFLFVCLFVWWCLWRNPCYHNISSSLQTKLEPCCPAGTEHAGKTPKSFKPGLCHPSACRGGNRSRRQTSRRHAWFNNKGLGSTTLAGEPTKPWETEGGWSLRGLSSERLARHRWSRRPEAGVLQGESRYRTRASLHTAHTLTRFLLKVSSGKGEQGLSCDQEQLRERHPGQRQGQGRATLMQQSWVQKSNRLFKEEATTVAAVMVQRGQPQQCCVWCV